MAKPHPLASVLSEAFGQTIDLDAYGREDYDVGEGPGERDFDADEYIESKAPTRRDGPSDEQAYADEKRGAGQNLRTHTAKADLRTMQDQAGRDADAMMAAYRTQTAAPSAVAAHLEDQKAQEDAQRRLLAIEWLRGGGR